MTFKELFADLEQKLLGRKWGNWNECQFCKHHCDAFDRV